MLRRRSRSTPTDDLELTAQHPVGVVGEDTSEELVLAAVDGELVNRALDRLSTRHRHVLAMREGSGWTYQQIADHEGVEIGTIETLLWRARQALKREFAVVSESKEALAGFLIATGALIRRTVFRAAHRGATVHHNSGGGVRRRCATPWQASPSPARPSPLRSSHRTRCRVGRAARHRRRDQPSPLRPSSWARRASARRAAARRGCAQALALGGPTDGSSGGSGAGAAARVGGRIWSRRWLQLRWQGLCGWRERGRLAARRCARWRVVVRHQRTLGRAEQHHRRTEHDGGRRGGRSEPDRRWRHGRRQRRRSAASPDGRRRQHGRRRHERRDADGRRRHGQRGAGVNSTVGGVTSSVNGITQSSGWGASLPPRRRAQAPPVRALLRPRHATTTTTTTNPVQGIVGGATKTVGGLLGG